MKTGLTVNEYGVFESVHVCDICGDEYTVCPPVSEDSLLASGCTAPHCESYDPKLDADRLFGDDTGYDRWCARKGKHPRTDERPDGNVKRSSTK